MTLGKDYSIANTDDMAYLFIGSLQNYNITSRITWRALDSGGSTNKKSILLEVSSLMLLTLSLLSFTLIYWKRYIILSNTLVKVSNEFKVYS
jgi:hypothetical protein